MVSFGGVLRRLCVWGLAGLSLLLTTEAARPYSGSYPYKAVATVGMVGDLVQNVAGARARITQIIGSGVDPHLYNPTRSDVAALLSADVVFYSGLLLEGRMTDTFVKIARQRPVYAVTERIAPEYLLPVGSGHFDPHVWMDVQGWIKALEAVVVALSEFDSAHRAEYEANGKTYRAQLEELDAYARKVLGSIPKPQRVMITAHDAFNYLGRAYGLEVMGIQGISTESEAGLADVNRLVDEIVRRKLPAVFVETSVSDKNVRALIEGARARGHTVAIGGQLFSDAMGAAGTYEGTYVGMIDHNVTTIARALGGSAPPKGMQGKLQDVSLQSK
ncbi:zinc ABC transporter substrate-binding protein [bacterium]|nr:zinc ABC transporter substrate-binding protein [bacterium]